jgi:hypothetical protein
MSIASSLSSRIAYAAGVKLSATGKMPCRSWSLQAIDTCPGSVDKYHVSGLVEACRGCYATQGNYRYPNVKAPRIHNQEDWKRAGWVDDMVKAIGNDAYFRWLDSGDLYNVALARKVLAVMQATPGAQHWLPTRMHKFKKFAPVLAEMAALPNVVVRASSDSIHGAPAETTLAHSSVIFDADNVGQARGAVICEAYSRAGKCGDCRACWNKSAAVIAYPQHGQTMARNNRDIIARAA